MLHEKIRNISAQLGELAGRLPEEDYEIVRLARINLEAVAESAAALEGYYGQQDAAPVEEVA